MKAINYFMKYFSPPVFYLIAEVLEIKTFAMDPQDGVIVEQLVKIKTDCDLVFWIWDSCGGVGGRLISVTSDMIGKKIRLVITTNPEGKIQKLDNEKPRVERVIPYEYQKSISDRLIMIAEIKRIFGYNRGYYHDVVIDASFGSIWLAVTKEVHSTLNIGDTIKLETDDIRLEEILNNDSSESS